MPVRAGGEDLLSLAVALVEFLPLVLDTLESGSIDLARARVFSDELCGLDNEDVERICCAELPDARCRTLGQLRARLARAALQVNPNAAQDRHERAKKNRDVRLNPLRDGMASVEGTMADDDAKACEARIRQLAGQLEDDGRRSD